MHELIAGTDNRNKKYFPITLQDAHHLGKPHQAVYIEIVYNQKYLVWKRDDNRFEIPGGHVKWIIEKISINNPMNINSALRHLLIRRNILIPIL